MIALILALGFALVALLVAIAAYIAGRAAQLLLMFGTMRRTEEYVSELRRRQFKSMDASNNSDSGGATVLHFPHPPGAA